MQVITLNKFCQIPRNLKASTVYNIWQVHSLTAWHLCACVWFEPVSTCWYRYWSHGLYKMMYRAIDYMMQNSGTVLMPSCRHFTLHFEGISAQQLWNNMVHRRLTHHKMKYIVVLLPNSKRAYGSPILSVIRKMWANTGLICAHKYIKAIRMPLGFRCNLDLYVDSLVQLITQLKWQWSVLGPLATC